MSKIFRCHGNCEEGQPSHDCTVGCDMAYLGEYNDADMACNWYLDDVSGDTWRTGCGGLFILNEGTIEENSMSYCHRCGRKIRESSEEK